MSATIFPPQLVFGVRRILYLRKDILLSVIVGSRQGMKKGGNRFPAE